MTTEALTPTQAARKEWLEREYDQLRAEGVPQAVIDAEKDPGLIREAWEKEPREIDVDPDTRKQSRETARVEAEREEYLESVREARRARDRAQQPIDLTQIEAAAAEAKDRLRTLIEQRSRIAPEAIADAGVRQELLNVESEIASCELAIELEPIAHRELERREKEAKEIEKARAPHLKEARRLGAERLRLASRVDEAAQAYAAALKTWDACTTDQEFVLRRAGLDAPGARPKPWQIECALMCALQDAGVPKGAVRLAAFDRGASGMHRNIRPLVELDPKPIEPEEGS